MRAKIITHTPEIKKASAVRGWLNRMVGFFFPFYEKWRLQKVFDDFFANHPNPKESLYEMLKKEGFSHFRCDETGEDIFKRGEKEWRFLNKANAKITRGVSR